MNTKLSSPPRARRPAYRMARHARSGTEGAVRRFRRGASPGSGGNRDPPQTLRRSQKDPAENERCRRLVRRGSSRAGFAQPFGTSRARSGARCRGLYRVGAHDSVRGASPRAAADRARSGEGGWFEFETDKIPPCVPRTRPDDVRSAVLRRNAKIEPCSVARSLTSTPCRTRAERRSLRACASSSRTDSTRFDRPPSPDRARLGRDRGSRRRLAPHAAVDRRRAALRGPRGLRAGPRTSPPSATPTS